MKLPGDAIALTGYALAAPFVLYPPLFKTMWNGRRHGLFAAQEAGVAMIVTGWALRGDKGAVTVNAVYGVALAATYAVRAGRGGGNSRSSRSSRSSGSSGNSGSGRSGLGRAAR